MECFQWNSVSLFQVQDQENCNQNFSMCGYCANMYKSTKKKFVTWSPPKQKKFLVFSLEPFSKQQQKKIMGEGGQRNTLFLSLFMI